MHSSVLELLAGRVPLLQEVFPLFQSGRISLFKFIHHKEALCVPKHQSELYPPIYVYKTSNYYHG